MKKLIASFAVLAAVAAQAEYMYWSVNASDIDSKVGDDIAYMRVGYVTANGQQPLWSGHALETFDMAGDEITGSADVAIEYSSGDIYTVDLTGIDTVNYSFYIELLNSSEEVIGRTGTEETHTYEKLASKYIVTGDIGEAQPINVWHGGAISAVPEPSSMALLALGAGLVGLRRKLKKAKKGKRA